MFVLLDLFFVVPGQLASVVCGLVFFFLFAGSYLIKSTIFLIFTSLTVSKRFPHGDFHTT